MKNDATDAKPEKTAANGRGGMTAEMTAEMTGAMTAITGAADFPGLFPPVRPETTRESGIPDSR